jgi:hypothetical protein
MSRLVFYKALCLVFAVKKFTKYQLLQLGMLPAVACSRAGIQPS